MPAGWGCRSTQHLSLIDYVVLGGALDDRRIEYVDELHEHFVAPVQMAHGRYVVPETPGYSIEMRPESLEEYGFPDGAVWAGSAARLK